MIHFLLCLRNVNSSNTIGNSPNPNTTFPIVFEECKFCSFSMNYVLLLCISHTMHKYFYLVAILLCCTFVVVIEGSRQFTKAYSRSLTINSECLDGHWFINGKPPPPEWVQSNGDLLLPANNWMTIGIVSLQCDSVTNIYEIMSPGMVYYGNIV